MNKYFKLAIGIILLTACSSGNDDNTLREKKLKEMLDDGVATLKKRTNNFNIYEGSYITVDKDSRFETMSDNIKVSIFSNEEMNLYDVMSIIEMEYKINTYLADLHSLSEEERNKIKEQTRLISFSGEMIDFLDYLSGLYGVSFEFKKDDLLAVNFYVSKTYNLDQYFDNSKSTTSLSIGGGEASGGGLTGSTSSSTEFTAWDKIQKYMEEVVKGDGRATIIQDFSLVKVTARPWIIEDIDEFLELIKRESKMQVAVQYRVISLSKTKLDQLAFKLGINSNSDGYTIVSEIVDAISLSQVSGGIAVNKNTISSRLDAIVQTISQKVISKGQFVGLPNRVMPINLTTTTAYIQEIRREQNESTGDINQATTPGEIVTGMSILILPKILDDGRIQLTSGFTEKRLINLASLSGIQLPTIDQTETLSTVILDSGNIELIALYSGNTQNEQRGLQLLGAGRENRTEDDVIAVIIGADSYKLSSSVSKRG